MPAISIDTFFACTLLVSAAVIATAFVTGTLQTQINETQDLNKQEYLRTIADAIVSGYGSPTDWGSTGTAPASFGLSAVNASGLFEVDIDKVSRLNSQGESVLSYPEVSKAARLNNVALGISVTQILSVDVELVGNSTGENSTAYTFRVQVSQDSRQLSASLHCYVVTPSFLCSVSNDTTNIGEGWVTVEVPNSSSGPTILVVFARASLDGRMTAYAVYPFAHLSDEPSPNQTYLRLSPLNYMLNVSPNSTGVASENCYALSYAYAENLTQTSETVYSVPRLLDRSPMILVVNGSGDSESFIEWCSYPQVPLEFGADFAGAEENVFTYTVAIKDALYRLTLRFGGVIR
ncbi:MAG: hypothetical protein ACE14S_12100 [Candidatus Bathyarchaeia archaeon]